MMRYEIQDLLPLVTRLTEQYTSKESTSVPYETAQMLMEAILYTVDECFSERDYLSKEGTDYNIIYQRGKEIILEKVLQAKEIYESLIENFYDYGCGHYKATIIKGMPKFFLKYDTQFSPQDHILTLEYPLLMGNPELSGIDLILEYLQGIQREKQLLDCFDNNAVINLLGKISTEYKTLYLDNICYSVLLCAVGCMISDKPLEQLILTEEDCRQIALYFQGDDLEKIEFKMKTMISMIISRVPHKVHNAPHKVHNAPHKVHNAPHKVHCEYFEKASRDYAIRIESGIENLSNIFHPSL